MDILEFKPGDSNMNFLKIYNLVKDRTLMAQEKLKALYGLAKLTESVDGVVAECGVFRGGSLMLLATVLLHKQIYGFDTFEGLPDEGLEDEKSMFPGRYAYEYDSISEYFLTTHNVQLIKGLFPTTAIVVEDKMFSFVHLDMDLYQCTIDGLRFFYPRMNRGAILISDDYKLSACPGIERAFIEFFADKPEVFFSVGLRQVAFIKE